MALVTNAQRAHLEGNGGRSDRHDCPPRRAASSRNWWHRRGRLPCRRRMDRFVARAEYGPRDDDLCARSSRRSDGPLSGAWLDNRLTIKGGGQEVEVTLACPAHCTTRATRSGGCRSVGGRRLAGSGGRGLNAFRGIKGRLQRRAGVGGAVLLTIPTTPTPIPYAPASTCLASTVGKKILGARRHGRDRRHDRAVP